MSDPFNDECCDGCGDNMYSSDAHFLTAFDASESLQ
jgi:hypothetical protein